MSEPLPVFAVLLCGALLGAVFYGGLWWTVRRIPSRAPGLWLVGSFLVRTVLVLSGFLIVTRGDWRGMLAVLAGFLTGRVAVTRLIRPRSAEKPSIASGAGS